MISFKVNKYQTNIFLKNYSNLNALICFIFDVIKGIFKGQVYLWPKGGYAQNRNKNHSSEAY